MSARHRTILALALLISGCGGQTKSVSISTQQVVHPTVFVGDSIIGTWDLDAAFPGKGYINGGWFGKRTDEMLAAFPSILDGSKVCHGFDGSPGDPRFRFSCKSIVAPSQIVILLGWNDLFQGMDSAKAAANITAMAQMAQAAHANIILVVPYRYDSAHPAPWMQPWDSCSDLFPFRDNQEPVLNAGIRATAAKLSIPIADLESLFTCQSDYTVDGIHPNASGFQQMHDAIIKALPKQG
jgi:GDSL-like Lipase/Acylhydrolase family